MGKDKSNPSDFAIEVDESDVKDFGFTDAFIFDLWGAITDAKQGRLKKVQDFNEQFWFGGGQFKMTPTCMFKQSVLYRFFCAIKPTVLPVYQ